MKNLIGSLVFADVRAVMMDDHLVFMKAADKTFFLNHVILSS
jgi:hypothetical protein